MPLYVCLNIQKQTYVCLNIYRQKSTLRQVWTLVDDHMLVWVHRCNKYSTQAQDIGNGETMRVWEKGEFRNSLYFPFNFVMNLKVL